MFGFIVSLLVPLSEEDARNDLEHETAEDDESKDAYNNK